MDHIIVTNRNSHPFTDGYCGIVYHFSPGEPVAVPIAAAKHILGFGEEGSRMPWVIRAGRANKSVPSNTPGAPPVVIPDPTGMDWLNNFIFSEPQAAKATPAKAADADFVVVTNLNKAPHSDGWAGKFWTFRPNEAVQIPVQAARHIFAWGIGKTPDDRRAAEDSALRRLGWNRDKDGRDRLHNFRCQPVRESMAAQSAVADLPPANAA